MSVSVARGCAEQFFEYISIDRKPYPNELCGSGVDDGFEHFLDYAYEWLWLGDGARICGNDFSVWMATIALATTIWCERERDKGSDGVAWPSFDCPVTKAKRKPPSSAMRLGDSEGDCAWCARVFDPWFFQQMVANPELGRRQIKISILNERGEDEKVKDLESRLNSAPWVQ
ncbi:hypothetical protein LO763_21740 [Glycomyces sp. A-F 0318]|uniref:hypothetical protein n=1 Tax=Glycomyces amatae TaxID=2881355 RepID=UPI001E4029DD|nr:hypothetical protein [Glycomyces amatae]MCD0446238.1 hypothetical protein [Glycomyces amatae]